MAAEGVYYEEQGPRRCSIMRKQSLQVTECDPRKVSTGSDSGRSESDTGSSDGGGSIGKRRKVGVASMNGDLQALIANAPSNISRNDSQDVPSPRSSCTSTSHTQRTSEDMTSLADGDASYHGRYSYSSNGIQRNYVAKKLSRSYSEGHDTLVNATDATRRNLVKMRLMRGHSSESGYDPAWDLDIPELEISDYDDELPHRKSFIPVIDIEKIRKISHADKSDFAKLMDMTKQLNLNPRRPSYLTWRASQNGEGKRRLHSLCENDGPNDTCATKESADGNNNSSLTEQPKCDITPCAVSITVTGEGDNHVIGTEHVMRQAVTPQTPEKETSVDGDSRKFSMSARCKNINHNLEWIKSELVSLG